MPRTLIALAGLLLRSSAWAEMNQSVQFSGFGTLGVAFNDDEGADYTATYEQATGVGRSNGPTPSFR